MVDKENNKNMNFPDVRNNEKDDYEEFDGEEITVIRLLNIFYYILLFFYSY